MNTEAHLEIFKTCVRHTAYSLLFHIYVRRGGGGGGQCSDFVISLVSWEVVRYITFRALYYLLFAAAPPDRNIFSDQYLLDYVYS